MRKSGRSLSPHFLVNSGELPSVETLVSDSGLFFIYIYLKHSTLRPIRMSLILPPYLLTPQVCVCVIVSCLIARGKETYNSKWNWIFFLWKKKIEFWLEKEREPRQTLKCCPVQLASRSPICFHSFYENIINSSFAYNCRSLTDFFFPFFFNFQFGSKSITTIL